MMKGMEVMSMSHMRVVRRLFVRARLMMFRCLFMVLCRVLVVFRRLAVVFRCRLRHCIPSFLGSAPPAGMISQEVERRSRRDDIETLVLLDCEQEMKIL
jgi:hypothetical protein